MTLDDVVKIVSELNDEIEDMSIREGYQFTVYTNGFEVLVYFNGIFDPIWSSEGDMRKLDEETDEYEPLRDYLLRELQHDYITRKKIVSGLAPDHTPVDVRKEILQVLLKKVEQEKNNIHDYCNPNFMSDIADALDKFNAPTNTVTEEEFDEIRGMIRDMYEC